MDLHHQSPPPPNNWGEMSIVNERAAKNEMMAITVLEVMLGLIFLIGGALNCILVAVFTRRRGFRLHLSNRFLMNLVLANLLACFVLIPLVLVDVMYLHVEDVKIGGFCSALKAVATLTSTGSILAQLLIGFDQHLAVLHPLHYHRLINESKCKLLCIATWIISISMAILASFDPSNSSEFSGLFQACQGQEISNYQYVMTLVIISATFVLPVLMLVVMYLRIFMAARDNSIRTRRNSSCSMTFEGVSVKNGQNYVNNNKYLSVSNTNIARHPSTTAGANGSNLLAITSSLRASMRTKLTYASNLLLYSEEGKAAKVTIFVLLSIAICWLPYFSVAIMEMFHPQMPQWIHHLGLICGLSNTIFSPILYAYRSIRIRRDVRKVFGLGFKSKAGGHKLRKANVEKAKACRLKSLSCPQLLISSVNDNETNSKSLFHSQFSCSPVLEEKPMLSTENSLALPPKLTAVSQLHSHSDVEL